MHCSSLVSPRSENTIWQVHMCLILASADWALQHLETDIISCGGVLKPLTADVLPPASSSGATETAHGAHQEAQELQPSHLALLLSDDWLQCFHTEK